VLVYTKSLIGLVSVLLIPVLVSGVYTMNRIAGIRGDIAFGEDFQNLVDLRNDTVAHLYYLYGQKQLSVREFEKGGNALRAALKLNPRLTQANVELALLAYEQNNDLEGATHFMEAEFALNPNNTDALMLASIVSFKNKDYNLARKYSRRVLELRPLDPKVTANLVELCRLEGRLDQGISIINDYLSRATLDRNWRLFLFKQSLFLLQLNREKEIFSRFKPIKNFSGKDGYIQLSMAAAYLKIGSPVEARWHMKEAKRVSGNELVEQLTSDPVFQVLLSKYSK
tara:strand:+ start:116 stop:964 length:849 start_codon:yes stop_codon:yes gene_type:complete